MCELEHAMLPVRRRALAHLSTWTERLGPIDLLGDVCLVKHVCEYLGTSDTLWSVPLQVQPRICC